MDRFTTIRESWRASERKRKIYIERQTDRETNRETERDRDRDRQRQRQRDRDRETETERGKGKIRLFDMTFTVLSKLFYIA